MNRIIATLAVGTITLSACGLGSVSADELRDQLIEDGIDENVADCIVDTLEAELSDDEFQDVATADTLEEIDADLGARATATIESCVLAG